MIVDTGIGITGAVDRGGCKRLDLDRHGVLAALLPTGRLPPLLVDQGLHLVIMREA